MCRLRDQEERYGDGFVEGGYEFREPDVEGPEGIFGCDVTADEDPFEEDG